MFYLCNLTRHSLVKRACYGCRDRQTKIPFLSKNQLVLSRRDISGSRTFSTTTSFSPIETKIMDKSKALDVNPADGQPKRLQNAEAFMQNIDAVMFDCDGVLWIGMRVLPHASDLVKKLRSMGKKVFFVTNNSTKTRQEFLTKFNGLGFEATLEEIVSTSYLAALHLKGLNFNKKVYVVGSTGITRELQAANIETLPIGPDVVPEDMATWSYEFLERQPLDPNVGAVVVGFDHHFSYSKLFKAASYLSDPNVHFIATNTDENFPSGSGKMVIPGTGSIVVSVETAAGRLPTIMGKPSKIPYDFVSSFHNLDSSRILMVGDRGNTDILFGTECGMHTLLVLTGVTSLEEVKEWVESGNEVDKKCVPEFFLDEVGDFYKLIKHL